MPCSIVIAILALAILLCLAAAVAIEKGKITFDAYKCFRFIVAVLTVVYAAITVWQLIPAAETSGDLSQKVKLSLIGFLIFWVLAPPSWFFFEYFAFESAWITNIAPPPAANEVLTAEQQVARENAAREAELKRIKNYADYASKIWAAVVALFGALVVLHGR